MINESALAEAIRRFPRILAECDRLERGCRFLPTATQDVRRKIVDHVWRWFLSEIDERAVEEITYEYRLIAGGMP